MSGNGKQRSGVYRGYYLKKDKIIGKCYSMYRDWNMWIKMWTVQCKGKIG